MFKIIPNNSTYHFFDISLNQLYERNIQKIVFIGNITDNRKDICNEFKDDLINYNEHTK
jgi:hypothetical protein